MQEYNYGQPSNWDLSSTGSVLDNGVWWNGTVPVNNWDEENAMQYNQLGCGDAGSDGTGSVILCDEDPVGNICTDGFDNDKDGMVDSNDNDFDGMLIVHQMMMMAMELQMKIQTVGILTAMECRWMKPPMDSTLHQHLTQMVQTAT